MMTFGSQAVAWFCFQCCRNLEGKQGKHSNKTDKTVIIKGTSRMGAPHSHGGRPLAASATVVAPSRPPYRRLPLCIHVVGQLLMSDGILMNIICWHPECCLCQGATGCVSH